MQSDLVVLSHLRWTWVWQRPQHLISRVGADRKIWFVEEPWPTSGVATPRLVMEDHGPVTRVWLEVPESVGHLSFEDDITSAYIEQLPAVVGDSDDRIGWLYTPLAIDIVRAVRPTVLVHDVMDDLASFKDAPAALVLRQRQVLREADVVFTGGRSLHKGIVDRRREATHLFPSGVEPEHYEQARSFTVENERPVAGYVGVIDERLDLDLVARLAEELPDWDIRMVGPITKIDDADLPRRENIHYLGPKLYTELPEVMAGFDVALMPFALNEATRSISPTKTLEYLAAGLPVVSTRVPDVVTDYETVVDLQDDAAGFADACRRVLHHDLSDRDRKLRPLLYEHHWNTIAARMTEIIDAAAARQESAEQEVTA